MWEAPAETKLSKELQENISILRQALQAVVLEEGQRDVLELIHGLYRLCATEEFSSVAEAQRITSGLEVEEMATAVHVLTLYFHLLNGAERAEILRRNEQKEADAKDENPRRESIVESVWRLSKKGTGAKGFSEALSSLSIVPTVTAHPTETRRRSIFEEQGKIQPLLARLASRSLPQRKREALLNELHDVITTLYLTDELRPVRPTVGHERNNTLYFFTAAIFDAVAEIHEDVRYAASTYLKHNIRTPPFLRFHSWIGGDRDGNPNVTSQVTRETIQAHRTLILSHYKSALEKLPVSISSERIGVPADLIEAIRADQSLLKIPFDGEAIALKEPFRLRRDLIRLKMEHALENGLPYSASDFLADLETYRKCLIAAGQRRLSNESNLRRLCDQAGAFGFHLAALDIRQHSKVHEVVVAELLRKAEVKASDGCILDYENASEPAREGILTNELLNSRPLCGPRVRLSAQADETLAIFDEIGRALGRDPASIRCYVVSMTSAVSDVLEVLLLMKEKGLWCWTDELRESALDIVPLFETVDDLRNTGVRLRELFENEAYRRQLGLRGNFQEVMFGYSDSNKDGGYMAAQWLLHRAQADAAEVCEKYGVRLGLFHGRGGSIARGGGRANQAIKAGPSGSHTGKIRFTEQGEVISFRYATAGIAHRHLEQIVSAVLETSLSPIPHLEPPAELLEELAGYSLQAYRSLIDREDFWDFYIGATPIQHLSHLPIASRPMMRGMDGVGFEDLRAIPWVMGWTQTRFNVPGWFGLGTALTRALREGRVKLEELTKLYRECPFFTVLIDNAQQEMARARIHISRLYGSSPCVEIILEEFELTRRMLIAVTVQTDLLDNKPVIKALIRVRNPLTDVLNLMQIEALRRFHSAHSDEEREEARGVILRSMSGIAAAMQSTG